jgi:hypothetical protein
VYLRLQSTFNLRGGVLNIFWLPNFQWSWQNLDWLHCPKFSMVSQWSGWLPTYKYLQYQVIKIQPRIQPTTNWQISLPVVPGSRFEPTQTQRG